MCAYVTTAENVLIENNTAAQITIKTDKFHGMAGMDIQVRNNTVTGGSAAPNKYGVYVIPNFTGYDLTVDGNTFTDILSHAISVQGSGESGPNTAANSITVTNNTFNFYGSGKAAFKIWDDDKFASSKDAVLTSDASALLASIKAGGNTFADSLYDSNHNLTDFYGTKESLVR